LTICAAGCDDAEVKVPEPLPNDGPKLVISS